MKISSDVWQRTGENTLSKSTFAMLMSSFTAIGIMFCFLCSYLTRSVDMSSWNWMQLMGAFIAVMGLGFLGIYIAHSTTNIALSLFGYALVAGPFGLLMGPMVADYPSDVVWSVGIETTLLVVALGFIGGRIKKDLAGWGNWLFGGLIILLLGMFTIPLMGLFGLEISGAWYWWNWVGIALFGALVIYDVNRAMRVPYTAHNAISCAIALFLDWLNIFLRLLGNSSND